LPRDIDKTLQELEHFLHETEGATIPPLDATTMYQKYSEERRLSRGPRKSDYFWDPYDLKVKGKDMDMEHPVGSSTKIQSPTGSEDESLFPRDDKSCANSHEDGHDRHDYSPEGQTEMGSGKPSNPGTHEPQISDDNPENGGDEDKRSEEQGKDIVDPAKNAEDLRNRYEEKLAVLQEKLGEQEKRIESQTHLLREASGYYQEALQDVENLRTAEQHLAQMVRQRDEDAQQYHEWQKHIKQRVSNTRQALEQQARDFYEEEARRLIEEGASKVRAECHKEIDDLKQELRSIRRPVGPMIPDTRVQDTPAGSGLTLQHYQQHLTDMNTTLPDMRQPPPGYKLPGMFGGPQTGREPLSQRRDGTYRCAASVPGASLLGVPQETYQLNTGGGQRIVNPKAEGIVPPSTHWGPMCTRTDLGPIARANLTFNPPKWLVEDEQQDNCSIWYDQNARKYILKDAEDAQLYREYFSHHDAMYGSEKSSLARKLGLFKGTTVEEFREYLHEFKQVARLESWVNIQKLNRLKCNLSLQLAEAVRSQEKRQGQPFVTFRDLKFCIYEELRSSHNIVLAQQDFKRRMRKTGESPRQYMRALLEKAELAYPKDYETRACEQFTQFVTEDDHTYQRMESYTAQQGRLDPEALVEISEDGERSSKSSMLAELKRAGYSTEDVESGKIDWQRPLQTLLRAQSMTASTPVPRQLVPGTDGVSKNVECYHCRYYGHFQFNCPLKTGNTKVQSTITKSQDSMNIPSKNQNFTDRGKSGSTSTSTNRVSYPIRGFSGSATGTQRTEGRVVRSTSPSQRRHFSPQRNQQRRFSPQRNQQRRFSPQRKPNSPQKKNWSPRKETGGNQNRQTNYLPRFHQGTHQIVDQLLNVVDYLGQMGLSETPTQESDEADYHSYDTAGTEFDQLEPSS
jgi:hypothetical protein